MNIDLRFDLQTRQLTGPAGALLVPGADPLTPRFLMLLEGECLQGHVTDIAHKYGLCRQRYYQIRDTFAAEGWPALQLHKTGPKSNYRRTDQAIRLVLRYRFLDPDASPEVITQKLNQAGHCLSLRSVHRIIADFGLQKKTLRAQPQTASTRPADPKHPHASAMRARRPAQPGTRGPAAPGR